MIASSLFSQDHDLEDLKLVINQTLQTVLLLIIGDRYIESLRAPLKFKTFCRLVTWAMSNYSAIVALPNPDTPLAFLSPNLAIQLEVYRYVAVATFGAFMWSVLTHVDTYHKLLFRNRITLATVAYFASIISNTAYIFCCVYFHVGTAKNCQVLVTVLSSVYAITFPTTSVLFLLRVHAVFSGQRVIMAFFLLCWLGLTGSAITLPFALYGSHLGPTNYCINVAGKPISPAAIIASAIFDSLVFFCISWRLLENSMAEGSFRDKMRAFFSGGALPSLSKALLHSGQVYYLITICVNITTAVLLLSKSVPSIYRSFLTTPNSALTCVMACKVYTDLKLMSHSGSTASLSSFLPTRRIIGESYPLPEPATIGFEKLTFNGIYPTRKEESSRRDSREYFPPSQTSGSDDSGA